MWRTRNRSPYLQRGPSKTLNGFPGVTYAEHQRSANVCASSAVGVSRPYAHPATSPWRMDVINRGAPVVHERHASVNNFRPSESRVFVSFPADKPLTSRHYGSDG